MGALAGTFLMMGRDRGGYMSSSSLKLFFNSHNYIKDIRKGLLYALYIQKNVIVGYSDNQIVSVLVI